MNSCLSFFKGLDFYIDCFSLFLWALTTMTSEAGHGQGEGLLREYHSDTFLDGTITYFSVTSKLLTDW